MTWSKAASFSGVVTCSGLENPSAVVETLDALFDSEYIYESRANCNKGLLG